MHRYITIAVTAALLGGLVEPTPVARGNQEDRYEPVAKATCGPDDRPETGLQGQVPPAERAGGFEGFSCNLELVGNYEGEGAAIMLASYRNCAYYSTQNPDAQENPGVVVLDVSDPEHPKVTDHLDELGVANPWESMKVHRRRGLLAGVQYSGPAFSIYSLKKDCRHPKLLSTIAVPNNWAERGARGHAGNFSADGKTYYAADLNLSCSDCSKIYVFDIARPRRPRPLKMFNPPHGVHDMSTNESGTKLYVANAERLAGVREASNGLSVFNVRRIQQRKKKPRARLIGKLYWADGAIAQLGERIYIKGKPYILFTDENGSGGFFGWSEACAAGLPPFGFARLIDISNHRKPKLVSRIMLEVNDPENCPVVLPDTNGAFIFSYDAHYCTVDNPRDAKLAACGWYESGVRIFDISQPRSPKEIAYYNPAGKPGPMPAGAAYVGDGDVQWELSPPQLRLQDCQIWVTTSHSAFQVLKLTNDVWPCG